MNIALTPELERLVRRRVRSGLYNSATEVVRESLRLLEQRDRMRQAQAAELRKEVARGLRQLETGRYTEYDDVSLAQRFKDIKAEGRRRLAKERQARR